ALLQTPPFFPPLNNRSSSDRCVLLRLWHSHAGYASVRLCKANGWKLAPSTCPNCRSRTTPYSQDAIETVLDVTKLFPFWPTGHAFFDHGFKSTWVLGDAHTRSHNLRWPFVPGMARPGSLDSRGAGVRRCAKQTGLASPDWLGR
ncbi:unnamed protein product, partial [Mycena citricolor]